MFKKWLIRAIRCALEPTAFNKHCLVLVGERQNTGKSTWCRYLCPPALSEYLTDSLGTDKDSLISLSQNFLINLDELSTLQKSDLQGLKSLFSLEIIKARRPYDRVTSRVPRTASFIGSTDRPEFLTDEAGSVRWQCIEINTIDWQYNTLPIDKVWAQAYAICNNLILLPVYYNQLQFKNEVSVVSMSKQQNFCLLLIMFLFMKQLYPS